MSIAASPPQRAVPWVAAVPRTAGSVPPVSVVPAHQSSPALSSLSNARVVIFEGVLHNRRDIEQELGANAAALGDADLLLLAYQRWGRDLPQHVEASCSLIVADGQDGRVLAVRDRLGSYPLFYAEAGGRLMFSTSIDALREQPGMDRAISRPALVDHLCHNWTDPHGTFFPAIRRVPRGHVLVADASGTTVTRYWEPVKAGQPIDWVTEEELHAGFERTFEQAAVRALSSGPTGIFLSGGLDSISVAAMATHVAKRDGHPLPHALSLGFPGEADEEKEQRGVAAALGLAHEFVPFDDAVPQGGLLPAALEMTRMQPAPMLNTWMPVYRDLVRRGRERGIRTILSGAGGDEWLSVSPTAAAEMMRRFEFGGLGRLMAGYRRSYNLTIPETLNMLLWKYGVRPLLGGIADRTAPQAYRANRVRRGMSALGTWAAPDPGLRQEVAERIGQWLPETNPPLGLYFRDTINTMEHPLAAMEGEELFAIARRLDVQFRHPYWDPAVVDILYRTPPLLLFQGGFSKSVVRATMARRFPGLGLESQKKRAATTFMRFVLERELPDMWRRNHDLSALADLKVVDQRAALAMAENNLSSGTVRGFARVWELLNTETWVRAHG